MQKRGRQRDGLQFRRLQPLDGWDCNSESDDDEHYSYIPPPTANGTWIVSHSNPGDTPIAIQVGHITGSNNRAVPIIVVAWPDRRLKTWMQNRDQVHLTEGGWKVVQAQVLGDFEAEISCMKLVGNSNHITKDNQLVVGYTDGTIEVYDISQSGVTWKHTTLPVQSDNNDCITCMACVPSFNFDSNLWFVCASASGQVRFWDQTLSLLDDYTLSYGDDPVLSCELVVYDNSAALILLCGTGDVSVWKFPQESSHQGLEILHEQVFSPDKYGDLVAFQPVTRIEGTIATNRFVLIGKRHILSIEASDPTEWKLESITNTFSLEKVFPESFETRLSFMPCKNLSCSVYITEQTKQVSTLVQGNKLSCIIQDKVESQTTTTLELPFEVSRCCIARNHCDEQHQNSDAMEVESASSTVVTQWIAICGFDGHVYITEQRTS